MLLGARERLAATAARAWSGFGRWRRSRPFWGGLLLVLSGLEMYGTAHQDLSPIKVSFGPQVFMSWLIPGALILCGLLVWFTPAQRAFYGILGGLIAVAALIGLNFAGFFIGLLLGLVGAAFTIAWTPSPRARHTEPSTPAVAEVAPVGPEPGDGPASSRLLTVLLIVAAMVAGLVTLVRPTAALAAPCPAPSTSSGAAAPTTGGTGAPSATPSASSSPAPNPIVQFFDNLGRLIGIGGGSSPSPTPSPSPSPTPTAKPAKAAAAAAPAAAAPNCGTTTTPKRGTSRSATPSPKPSASGLGPGSARAAAIPAGQPRVNNRASTQLSAKLVQTTMIYDGVVDLPVAGGTLRALEFHLGTAESTPFELQITVADTSGYKIKSTDLKISGSVVLYATEVKGTVGVIPGIDLLPEDYTPSNPPQVLGIPLPPGLPVPYIEFKDAVISLVFVHADTLTAANLTIGR